MRLAYQRLAFVLLALFALSLASAPSACSRCGGEQKRRAHKEHKKTVRAPRKQPQEIKVELPKSKGVVLIVIDAMRADRLGCYGYDKPTTPSIDAFAEEGVVFERFHAAAPWTAPSMGTIFTGVPPSIHRCGRAPRVFGRKQEVIALDANLPTVASLLPDGVKTAAVVNNNFLDPSLGFSKGFDSYDYQIVSPESERGAAGTTDAAIAWLEKNKDAPFFLYVHYFDPHMPYGPKEKYIKQFAPKEKPAAIDVPLVGLAKVRVARIVLGSPEADYIRGLYDGEVRYTDDEIGRLFARMKELGLLDDSWVVLTADHGEEHFDHGGFEHGHRYEEEVLRVPLIVRAPGGKWRAGTRVPYNASHLDLAPTILAFFGVLRPAHFEGASVASLMSGAETAHREAGAEYNLFFDNGFAYTDGNFKFVLDLDQHTGFMYDLVEDPKELTRLDDSHADFARIRDRAMALHLDWRGKARRSIAKTAALSDEARGALEALGYLEKTANSKASFDPNKIQRLVNP
jgi:arylsulfatase A-like enzyme